MNYFFLNKNQIIKRAPNLMAIKNKHDVRDEPE